MNRKIFLACLSLLLPLCVLAAGHPVTETDLLAYKELSQARTDALKESLQKDIQAQTVRIEMQDKRIEQQNKLLDSFSARISDLSIVLTVFGLMAGLLGYFTVASRAQKEARIAAEEWIKKEGQKAIDTKLKELDSHIAAQINAATTKRQEFDGSIDRLKIEAAAQIAEQQNQIVTPQKIIDDSVQIQISSTNDDPISQLVEALKHKPEAEYGFDDWNARAHDAYKKGNLALAAEHWLQAARGGKANGAMLAQSLFNAGVVLSQLNRKIEAIVMFDEVESRYGSAPEVELRIQVAQALVNKGVTLGQLKREVEAIAVYDEVESRYGSAPEAKFRELVAKALLNKGVTLGQLKREVEAIAVCDEVESRYGSAPEVELRIQVAQALVNKGVTLGQLKREVEAIAVYDEVESRYGSAPEAKFRELVAKALLNKGVTLGQLKREVEAIAVCDEVESRYGSAPEVELRIQVAQALVNKGITLGKLKREVEAIAACDEVESRYGSAPEAKFRELVAKARNSKGYALLCRAKENWPKEAARLADLQAAATLFTQAEKEVSEKYVVWGNQAYTFYLLGQEGDARILLKQALQQGGEWLYKATLDDLNIHTVSLDTEFRSLLEGVWAEVRPKVLS
ncbi:MAG: hypothetical protein PHD65_07700 [Gallionella sp.]|nr:hypothetical protein [Gallionella sp.]